MIDNILNEIREKVQVVSYILTNGTEVIAEEIDYEEYSDRYFLGLTLKIVYRDNKVFLETWMKSSSQSPIVLNGSGVVGKAVTSEEVREKYINTIIREELKQYG